MQNETSRANLRRSMTTGRRRLAELRSELVERHAELCGVYARAVAGTNTAADRELLSLATAFASLTATLAVAEDVMDRNRPAAARTR